MRQKQEFKASGYLCTSNLGGLEIEIDDTGEALRVRDGEKVGRWQRIHTNRDGSTYFLRGGRRWRLDEFMRV